MQCEALESSEPLPDLTQLHLRHMGLTPAICHSYAEAAGVCLSRHHTSPPVEFILTNDLSASRREIQWHLPDERAKRAWANRDDATRDGAYSISIAAVEVEYGLFAIVRADVLTGADYFVAAPGGSSEDLEEALRLEISGTEQSGESAVQNRLRRKIVQVRKGKGDFPALVAVVGFRARRIAMAEVKEV